MAEMTDEQLQKTADFYGISMEDARYRICQAHTGDPHDPICVGCARRPSEIQEYIDACTDGEDVPVTSADEVRWYVISNEGTYNEHNGHFLCDDCYIRNGMPSSERGWVCP
jgi:predicted Fe-S protein YdhL (DUF1289 family)